MAWTTGIISQNGNTTWDYVVDRGVVSGVSGHDAVVLKSESMRSYTSIERIKLRIRDNGWTRYRITVKVWGSHAVSFRFAAEKMN